VHTLSALGDLLAAVPTLTPKPPSPGGTPAAAGASWWSGDWVGPTISAGIAGGLDYSAWGSSAIRDRLAVFGYYAATVGFALLVGWTAGVRAQFSDPQMQDVGAWIAGLSHLGMIAVFLGRPKIIAKNLRKLVRFHSADSDAARINGTLLGWTVVAALSAPLALGPMAGLVNGIGLITTHTWDGFVQLLNHFMTGRGTS